MSLQEKAFPNPHLTNETGMTLRDYFAAMALQGLLSSIGEWTAGTKGLEFSDTVAEDAYWIADSMMEARK
jgi:hypothetical protein